MIDRSRFFFLPLLPVLLLSTLILSSCGSSSSASGSRGSTNESAQRLTPSLALQSGATAYALTPFSLTVIVASGDPRYTPSGVVTLTCVASDGSACFSGTITLPQTSYTVASLEPGVYTVSAGYSGDTRFNPATATTQIQVGQPYTVSIPASSFVVVPGGSVSIPVAVNTPGTFQGTLNLAISGLPSGVTFSPSQIPSGATTNVLFAASSNVDAEDFTGATFVYSYDKPLVVTATSGNYTGSAQTTLTVSVDNQSFVPAQTYLPVLQITTDSGLPVTSKDTYVSGSVTLTDPTVTSNNYSGTMTIKGHGNTTWQMPKKPYNLKLTSKASILGMPKSKSWVLLANFDDKTLMRDAVASEIATRLGMAWAPRSRFIEVFFNGQYEGVYQVSEKVSIDSNRVNITEMDDTDNSGDALTGGYLMEIDQTDSDDYHFVSTLGTHIGSEDPDPPTAAQQGYISSYVNQAEAALESDSFTDVSAGWRAWFDEGSLVKWYLSEEMMGNQDGIFVSSDYFYKDRNNPLLYMGPIWDFDVSSGNVNYSASVSPDVLWIRSYASWYVRLFQDPSFVTSVQTQYTASRAPLGDILNYIDQTAASLDGAEQNNFNRWPILNELVWPNPATSGSYQGEVDALKSWLTERLVTLDGAYLNTSGNAQRTTGPTK